MFSWHNQQFLLGLLQITLVDLGIMLLLIAPPLGALVMVTVAVSTVGLVPMLGVLIRPPSLCSFGLAPVRLLRPVPATSAKQYTTCSFLPSRASVKRSRAPFRCEIDMGVNPDRNAFCLV